MNLLGIHHLTAVSSRIRDNYQFYTNVMGMRLVKRSVNQDDVRAYHLFYSGSAKGVPGNDLTFFDWDIPKERRGTHSITRTYLRVNGYQALSWWSEWLKEHHIHHNGIHHIDGKATLFFEDPEGQRLALIEDGNHDESHHVWERSNVPADYQIRGQGPIQLSVPELAPTDALLTKILNMRQVRNYAHPENKNHTIYVYEMGHGGAQAEIHVAEEADLHRAQLGAGGVHHVAFRTPNDTEYQQWISLLQSLRIPNSGPVDRFWFRSLYFREPNGILFEIATDGPGFTVDEEEHTLGEKIVLPPFLEPRRTEIVANLKTLD